MTNLGENYLSFKICRYNSVAIIFLIEIVNQMKDQVPVVLLNQWLGIVPEKSCFSKSKWCAANSDEYSIYSSEKMSQALSIKGTSIKPINALKRGSLLISTNEGKNLLSSEIRKKNRRMTILNNKTNLVDVTDMCNPIIDEVEDTSNSDNSSDTTINCEYEINLKLVAHRVCNQTHLNSNYAIQIFLINLV